MHLNELIKPEFVVSGERVSSKKRLLELIGDIFSKGEEKVVQMEVFDSLQAREKLGSTGLGKGIAIPHGRLKGIEQAMVAFIQLDEAIDFDAIDGSPVDLLCALLVPEESTEEHLQLLAEVAERFRDDDFCNTLRQAGSTQQLYDALVGGTR